MSIEQDIEILKSVKIARQNYARALFHNIDSDMYCPVCGMSCKTFYDVVNRRKILHCPYCHTKYNVTINGEMDE